MIQSDWQTELLTCDLIEELTIVRHNCDNHKRIFLCHGWFVFQPGVQQDSSLTRINRGLWCHMCPIKTHVTNLLISVESRTGNSFGSLSVLCQANTGHKN